MAKQVLYPHVPGGVKKAAPAPLPARTTPVPASRLYKEKQPVVTTTPEEEKALIAAREVMRDLQPLKKPLQKIYDKVKGSIEPGWSNEGPREKAADLLNGVGELEFELTRVIEKIRAKRK